MGARIRLLDPAVIDRIAAGEVVERPASVVKELVENALDAGATRVDVRVGEGGVRLVEVADDGHGMEVGDAELAFAQHATSKIDSVEDLDAVETLGFRGEALASIASVARVTLSSGTGDGDGVRVRVDGTGRRPLEPIGWPRGTTVRVEDLFFNTPARRKHLATRATEFGHIAQTVVDYALAHVGVHFTLRHDGRTAVAAPPVATLQERVHQVFGREVASAWIGVDAGGEIAVRGGVTAPEIQRPNRRHVRWFVNRRPVSDYRLTHALRAAYDRLLDSRHYPVAAVFLSVAAAAVDVNVHPRKAEVRFADPGRVYGAVRAAVRTALARHLPPPEVSGPRRSAPPSLAPAQREGKGEGARGAQGASRVRWARPAAGGGDAVDAGDAEVARHATLPLTDWTVSRGTGRGADEPVVREPGPASFPPRAAREPGIAGTRGTIQPLAQYANTYILAADENGLLIIDQHVAHERILFERLLDEIERREVDVQHLLVPENVELSAAEAAVAEEQADLLARFGFELEPFGGDSFVIRSVPALLGARDSEATLRSLLDALAERRDVDAVDEARRAVAATVACHAAVRANHPLAREEMVQLVADLATCETPNRCPHGRPVMLRLSLEELEKRIGRR